MGMAALRPACPAAVSPQSLWRGRRGAGVVPGGGWVSASLLGSGRALHLACHKAISITLSPQSLHRPVREMAIIGLSPVSSPDGMTTRPQG